MTCNGAFCACAAAWAPATNSSAADNAPRHRRGALRTVIVADFIFLWFIRNPPTPLLRGASSCIVVTGVPTQSPSRRFMPHKRTTAIQGWSAPYPASPYGNRPSKGQTVIPTYAGIQRPRSLASPSGLPRITNEVQHFIKVLPWDAATHTSTSRSDVTLPDYVPRDTPCAKSRQVWIASHQPLLVS